MQATEQLPDPFPDPLLDNYINHNYNLRALSRSTNTPIPDLLTWLSTPQTKQTLADLRAATTEALALRASEARLAAIDALEQVLQATDDLIEKRRAATALLRALNARPQRPIDDTAPAPNPELRIPITVPSSPSDVLNTVLQATSRQLGLDPDEALTTLHACCAPNATINNEPIAQDPDDFLEDANDLPHLIYDHVQIITEDRNQTDTTYTHHASIIHQGGRTTRAIFTLKPTPSPTQPHSPLRGSPQPSATNRPNPLPNSVLSVPSVVKNSSPWRITNLQLTPIPRAPP